MAITVGELEARLHADVSDFISGMRRATQAFQQTSNSISAGANSMVGLTSSINGVQNAVGKLSNKMNMVFGAIGAGFILPQIFSAAKTAVIDFNQQVDQATVALTNFLGSGTEAKQMIGELQDFAARTPFQFQDLLGTTQSMMAMGVAAEDVLPRMQAIGDAAAAMGGSPEVLARIQRALGQIQAKGRVQSEELLQLAEAGIPAYQYLADAMGTTTSDLMDSLKKGAVDSTTAINALLDGMGRDFGGMMEEQSKTMMGAMSTVMDYVQITIGAIFRPFFETLRDAFVAISNLLSSEGMKEGAANFAQSIATVIGSIKNLIGAFAKGVSKPFMDLMKAMGSLVTVAVRLGKALQPMVTGILVPLGAAVIAITKAVVPLVKSFASLAEMLSRNQVVMYAIAGLLMAKFVTGFGASGKAAGAFNNVIAKLFSTLGQSGKDAATYFRVLRAEGNGAFQSIKLAAQTAGLSVKAFGMAMLTAMAQLLPLMLAFMAIGKAMEAFSNRNRDAEERTKELTQAIRENTDAILAQENALTALSKGGLDPLNDALVKTGTEGEETTNALISLGKSSKDYVSTMRDFKKSTYDSAYALAKAKGFTDEQAQQMAQYVKTADKGKDSTHKNAMAMRGFTPEMIAATMALEQLDDASENTNFAKMTQEIINATIRSDEATQKFYDQAKALAASAQASGQKMSADEEAIFVYEKFIQLSGDYAEQQKRIEKANASLEQSTESVTDRMLALIAGMKDGKVSAEEFLRALMGASKYAKTNAEEAFFNMSVALGNFGKAMKDTKGNQNALVNAGYDFKNMLGENQAQILAMGGSLGDVDAAMEQMVNAFYAQGQAAGWSKDALVKVLQAMGLLKENGDLILSVDVRIKGLEELRKTALAIGDTQMFNAITKQLYDMNEQKKRSLNLDLKSIILTNEAGDAASKLYDDFLAYMEARLQMVKDYLDGLKESANALRQAVASAIVDTYSFADALSSMQSSQDDFTAATQELEKAQKGVQDAIKSRNIQDYLSSLKTLQEASDKVAEADKSRLTYMQALEQQYKKAKDFEVVINRLRAAGLNEAGLKQIIAMGAEQGTLAGNELLNAGADAISRSNEMYKALADSAKQTADATSSHYYDAGIEMAKSLLRGVEDTIKNFKLKLKGKSLSKSQIEKMKKDFDIETSFTMSVVRNAESAVALAKGGVVMPRPGGTLARIGEAGKPEAVIPLSRAGLGGVMSTTNVYEIHVTAGVGDPAEIGQAIVDYLKVYEKRSGAIPIKVKS